MIASSAWIITLKLGIDTREYCIDACLSKLVEVEWRKLALVYPKTSCTTAKPNTRIMPCDCMSPDALLSDLLGACASAKAKMEELEALRRRVLIELLVSRRPSRVEEELYEVRGALELCNIIFGEGHGAELLSAKQAYIVYSKGGSEFRRVKSLSKIDNGIRGFLAGAGLL